jgi:hypothetical protein
MSKNQKQMKSIVTTLFIIHFTLSIISCSAPDKIGTLDLVQWRNDRGGCAGQRIKLLKDFEKSEPELLSKHIDTITKALGRPDIFQLGGRDTKFYVYFFETGTHCQDKSKPSIAKRVTLKFNAIGLLSEIKYNSGI